LSDWAKQGVLLLNNILTVEDHKPNAHRDFGWTTFTDNIIKYISDNLNKIIFVLWGNFAQTKIPLININKHYIIKSAHPSPLSAYNGFFGSKPFSRINSLLIKNNKTPIEWQ
jgi:uracil-DNA glycosylase